MKSFLHKLFSIVFFLGFIIIPLTTLLEITPSKEVIRVVFFNRWVELLLIISSILFFFKKKLRISGFFLVMIFFFLFSLIFSSFGIDTEKSLWGNYYRNDGLITYFHLLAFSAIVYFFWEEKFKNIFIYSNIFASCLSSFLFIISKIIAGRFFSLGQPILLSGYLLITFPFIFYLFQSAKAKKQKILFASILLLQIVAICLTGSFGGILGLGFFFLLEVINLNKKNKKIFIGGVIFFLITTTLLVVNIKFHNKNQFVAESRERIFTKLILGWTKKPFLGYGWANVDYAFEAVPWPITLTHDVYVDKAHSNILEVLVTTGVVGLFFYLLMLIITFKRLIEKNKKTVNKLWWKTLFYVFLLYLFHSQTNVISITEEIIFYFLLGITAV